MKSKSVLILFLLLSFFSVIITSAPVFAAATQQQPNPAYAATEQKLPAWLTETGAVPVSDAALENAQGEAIYYELFSVPWWVSGWKDFFSTFGKGHRLVLFQASGTRIGNQHVFMDSGASEKNWTVWNFGNNYYGVLVPTTYAIIHPLSWWKVALKDS